MSLKLKSLEQLNETNLKGYCYYVDAWGMSMTSRSAYDPELWIVLEDDGTKCKVAEYRSDGKYTWTRTSDKKRTAIDIYNNPCISATTNENLVKELA